MPHPIPEPILRADRAHHVLLQEVSFSQHLNPTNGREAREAFLRGAAAPPFEYAPLAQADDLLARLDAADPPRDHPAGALIGRCIDGTRLLVLALRDRTEARFDALALAADWYPEPESLALSLEDAPAERFAASIPAPVLIARLREALDERSLSAWRVVEDPVMAARVLVDGAKKLLRVHPQARFRPNDLSRLVVHEIDVHAWRAANGERQRLRCFETGLPGSLQTEEGLALVAEEEAGVSSPGVLYRQLWVLRAIEHGRQAGFRAVYERLTEAVGPDLAWGISLRIKRGLGRPGEPGVYAKDSVYLRGRMAVRAWLDAGGAIDRLYVGKVGLFDPVEEWISQGWVSPGPVPALWSRQST